MKIQTLIQSEVLFDALTISEDEVKLAVKEAIENIIGNRHPSTFKSHLGNKIRIELIEVSYA